MTYRFDPLELDLARAELRAGGEVRLLGRADFFRSFPMKSEVMRARVADALARFGF